MFTKLAGVREELEALRALTQQTLDAKQEARESLDDALRELRTCISNARARYNSQPAAGRNPTKTAS